eukprot:496232_1
MPAHGAPSTTGVGSHAAGTQSATQKPATHWFASPAHVVAQVGLRHESRMPAHGAPSTTGVGSHAAGTQSATQKPATHWFASPAHVVAQVGLRHE